ncbi:MAG: transglutaminase domain-containing protein [Marinilabilia sp.]
MLHFGVWVRLLLSGFGLIIVISCTDHSSLISGPGKGEEIRERVKEQKKLASDRYDQLFSVYNQDLSKQEREGLDFLFAYMPLSDLSNQDGEFYLEHVRYALKTRDAFSWGKKVPDDLFLHYVMPHRVNNEYTDTARKVFYSELKDRLQGMSMREAALEVNHWCHEKVIYHSTDEYRTSSPLSTVKTAYGRCGEQSTFTVAAMRAAGIPARQIYTPKWAHSDDNHAWVEVWIDGEWYFMGASEPEPRLNMGWFEAPATRAMLLHHRTYGHIDTDEAIVQQTPRYTEVNVLERYAPADSIVIQVLDDDDQPLENARVEFQLVNFAEFFPIAVLKTDNNGICELTAGKGDLVVSVDFNGKGDWKQVSVPDTDTLRLSPAEEVRAGTIESFTLTPPSPSQTPDYSDVDRGGHQERLHKEDSIRRAYEDGFIDSTDAWSFAEDIGIDPKPAWEHLEESRGNWQTVKSFMEYGAEVDRDKTLALLSLVSPKDRRDTPFEVFRDHLDFSDDSFCENRQRFEKYVLNPRINDELISAYKEQFQRSFGQDFIQEVRDDPERLVSWTNEHIEVNDAANDWGVPQLPAGVLELRVADPNSRNIFFVAAARSFGIPARVEPVFSGAQIFVDDDWLDVDWANETLRNTMTGNVIINYSGGDHAPDKPVYYRDFTIARYDGGVFTTLDFSGQNEFDDFPAAISLEKGTYALVAVHRLEGGTLKVNRRFFEVTPGSEDELTIDLPAGPSREEGRDLPKVDLNRTVTEISGGEEINAEMLTGEDGLVLIWMDPSREPTKHLLNDLVRLRSNFNNWEGNILILLKPEKIPADFSVEDYQGLPERSYFARDGSGWLEELEEVMDQSLTGDMPAAFVIDPSGEVVFSSSGYNIGTGDDILGQVVRHCQVP